MLHAGAVVSWLAPYASLRGANVDGTRTMVALAALGAVRPLHLVSESALKRCSLKRHRETPTRHLRRLVMMTTWQTMRPQTQIPIAPQTQMRTSGCCSRS